MVGGDGEAPMTAEERLELFGLLVEEAKDYAIFLLSPDGTVASWNSGAERIKGYRAEEIVGQHFSRFYRREDVAAGKPARELAQARVEGRVEDEGWRVRKDGSLFWADVVITALHDDSGNVRGFSKVTRDLTERRRSELALRERDQQLAVMLESIGDAVIATDKTGCVTFMNHVASSLTGWLAAEAAGAPLINVFRIVDEETRATVDNPVERVLREGVIVGLANHTLLIARDGQAHPIADSAAPIIDPHGGAVLGVVLVFRDQTAERAAEERRHELIREQAARESAEAHARQLRDSEEQLRVSREWLATVLGSIGDAVITTDANGIVTYLNTVAEQVTGWKSDEAIGKSQREIFSIINEDSRDLAENPVERAIREGAIEGLANHTILVRRDGREISIDDSAAPIRDGSGALAGVVLVFRDITDRRRAEMENQRARADAEQACRAKDEFLALLGHELRNPLAPILTALDLMKLRDGEVLKRERSTIERQVKHLVRLVDDLLDVSRITRGKVELHKQPTLLAHIVARAVETASPLLEERQHRLTVLVPQDLMIDGDAGRLSQVIANLLNNAAKFTEKAGDIAITAEQSNGEVTIRVRDNGIGIAPEVLPRIFDPFVQEAQGLDRALGGLGLGLAIVRSLVSRHGGTVNADSPGVGKGTEVTIRLPALDPTTSASASPDVAPVAPAARPAAASLLIVDDNIDAADTMAEALRAIGYESHVAYDGPSALALAEKVHPQIAILDIGLPVMDGYELARRLRDLRGLHGIKVVAVTGYGQQSDRERSKKAGFDEHLVKPIELPALQRALERQTSAR